MRGTRSSERARTDDGIVKHALPARRGWTPAVAAALLSTLALPAWAADACPRDSRLADYPPMVSLRVDNDLFAGRDEGYTSGVGLTLVSPNLRDYVDDPCLPAPARLVNRYLEWLQPEGFEQQNMVVTVGQGIFTPGDGTRRDLILEDRPYAGALLVGFGYNARQGNQLRTTQLVVGMVGPASLAEKTQRLIHKFTGSDNFEGWDHQLRNEPVLNLVHERLWRSEVRARLAAARCSGMPSPTPVAPSATSTLWRIPGWSCAWAAGCPTTSAPARYAPPAATPPPRAPGRSCPAGPGTPTSRWTPAGSCAT